MGLRQECRCKEMGGHAAARSSRRDKLTGESGGSGRHSERWQLRSGTPSRQDSLVGRARDGDLFGEDRESRTHLVGTAAELDASTHDRARWLHCRSSSWQMLAPGPVNRGGPSRRS